jgi:hypothetical protein
MCGDLVCNKNRGHSINGYTSDDMYGEISCFVLGPNNVGPLEVRLINTLSQLPQFDLYLKVGPNAGYLSFTSTVPEHVTFLGTALTAGQLPPENLPYIIANVYTAYNDLNLLDFQRVLVNSTSIAVTSPYKLDVIPSSQGRYSFTHSGSSTTWFQICTINAPLRKKHFYGVGGSERLYL